MKNFLKIHTGISVTPLMSAIEVQPELWGEAGVWKLGVAVASAGLVLNTTSYVEIDIGGTIHKLAKVV